MPICSKCGVELDDSNWPRWLMEMSVKTCRACELARRTELRAELKEEAISAYGGKCVCCGEAHIEFLTLDHRGGGGNKQREELFGDSQKGAGDKFYAWLRKNGYPQNIGIRCLCWCCQESYSIYGYCPHNSKVKGDYGPEHKSPDLPPFLME